MNVNDLFPSKYLKAHDLGGKAYTLTIRSATLEELGFGNEKERKLALAFDKAAKLMLLNRTNAMIIASMYGPETDGWIGKAVTVYSARVKAFGQWHDALRIKEQIPARNVREQPITEAMQEAPPIDDEEDLLDVDEGNEPRYVDPDTGEIVEPGASVQAQDGANGYAHLIDKLTGDCLERANRARNFHAQGKGPATPEQYRYLSGVIDDLVGVQKAHNAILEVFVGRAVNGENPPSILLASKLLDALVKEKPEEVDGQRVMVPNPSYSVAAVNCVHTVWRLVQEANGQQSLFEPQPEAA